MREKFRSCKNETKLYINSLKSDTSAEKLSEVFSQFGEVKHTSVRDHKKPFGEVLRFGFVEFVKKEDASKALVEGIKNPGILEISVIQPAYIKFAQAKEIRRQYLKIQHNQKLKSKKSPFTTFNQNGFAPQQPPLQLNKQME